MFTYARLLRRVKVPFSEGWFASETFRHRVLHRHTFAGDVYACRVVFLDKSSPFQWITQK